MTNEQWRSLVFGRGELFDATDRAVLAPGDEGTQPPEWVPALVWTQEVRFTLVATVTGVLLMRSREETHDWTVELTLGQHAPVTAVWRAGDRRLNLTTPRITFGERVLVKLESARGSVQVDAFMSREPAGLDELLTRPDEWKLVYQPIAGIGEQRFELRGFEALLRTARRTPLGTTWAFPPEMDAARLGPVERLAHLNAIIFRRALEDARRHHFPLAISVNANVGALESTEFIDALVREPEGIQRCAIEVVEEAADWNADLRRGLKRLAQAGYKLIMDDYGDGKGDIEKLLSAAEHDIHFGYIKLDRKMLQHLGEQPARTAYVKGMAETAKALFPNRPTLLCLEGAEPDLGGARWDAVRAAGVALLQGYYFLPPRCLSAEAGRGLDAIDVAGYDLRELPLPGGAVRSADGAS